MPKISAAKDRVNGSPEAAHRANAAKPNNGEETALVAYELWQARGCPDGSPDEDWFSAEQELGARRASRRTRTSPIPGRPVRRWYFPTPQGVNLPREE